MNPPSDARLTFLPHLDVLADSDVFTPRLLDDPSVAVILPLPHLLQQEELQKGRQHEMTNMKTERKPRESQNATGTETFHQQKFEQNVERLQRDELSFQCVTVSYRLWSFDEDFALAQLELVLVHVDRVEEVQDSLALLTPPAGPGVLGEDGIPAAQRRTCVIVFDDEDYMMSPCLMSDLCRNLLKTRLYAYPARRTLMFSRRPRYSTWCLTRFSSQSRGRLVSLGLMQRM